MGITVEVRGGRLNVAVVAAWRIFARTDEDRATCDVVARNLEHVEGAVEWPECVDVTLVSGEHLVIGVDWLALAGPRSNAT